jgi:hypothetical protein
LANTFCHRPAFYPLEAWRSLQLWFDTGADLADLLDGARTLFRIARIAGGMRGIDQDRDILDGIKGARHLAYAKICRIGLWPARDNDDLAVKRAASAMLHDRMRDGDRYLAIAQWALELGDARGGAPTKS